MEHRLSMLPATAVLPASGERRILRIRDVESKVGFKRAYIYQLIGEGTFPKPIPLGLRAVGWDSTEIEAWITHRIERRRAP